MKNSVEQLEHSISRWVHFNVKLHFFSFPLIVLVDFGKGAKSGFGFTKSTIGQGHTSCQNSRPTSNGSSKKT